MAVTRSRDRGFTLVEVLVVVAIIGILMAMLFPAVQSARETGRRLTCQNNLKQLGLAANTHVVFHGYYPSGGWSCFWTGDPDMGFGARQPGGWHYSLLPFLELENLHGTGKGMTVANKKVALKELRAAVVPTFVCPSRRRSMRYPLPQDQWNECYNADLPETGGKTDYAANAGSRLNWGRAPSDPNCLVAYPDIPGLGSYNSKDNGVVSFRSETQPAHILDGASYTIFAAEKFLSADSYYTGDAGTDDNTPFQGFDWDFHRWVPTPTWSTDGSNAACQPMRDVPGFEGAGSGCMRFGSAHPSGFQAVFCDGSVHPLKFDIDPTTFSLLGIRNDETPVDLSRL